MPRVPTVRRQRVAQPGAVGGSAQASAADFGAGVGRAVQRMGGQIANSGADIAVPLAKAERAAARATRKGVFTRLQRAAEDELYRPEDGLLRRELRDARGVYQHWQTRGEELWQEHTAELSEADRRALRPLWDGAMSDYGRALSGHETAEMERWDRAASESVVEESINAATQARYLPHIIDSAGDRAALTAAAQLGDAPDEDGNFSTAAGREAARAARTRVFAGAVDGVLRDIHRAKTPEARREALEYLELLLPEDAGDRRPTGPDMDTERVTTTLREIDPQALQEMRDAAAEARADLDVYTTGYERAQTYVEQAGDDPSVLLDRLPETEAQIVADIMADDSIPPDRREAVARATTESVRLAARAAASRAESDFYERQQAIAQSQTPDEARTVAAGARTGEARRALAELAQRTWTPAAVEKNPDNILAAATLDDAVRAGTFRSRYDLHVAGLQAGLTDEQLEGRLEYWDKVREDGGDSIYRSMRTAVGLAFPKVRLDGRSVNAFDALPAVERQFLRAAVQAQASAGGLDPQDTDAVASYLAPYLLEVDGERRVTSMVSEGARPRANPLDDIEADDMEDVPEGMEPEEYLEYLRNARAFQTAGMHNQERAAVAAERAAREPHTSREARLLAAEIGRTDADLLGDGTYETVAANLAAAERNPTRQWTSNPNRAARWNAYLRAVMPPARRAEIQAEIQASDLPTPVADALSAAALSPTEADQWVRQLERRGEQWVSGRGQPLGREWGDALERYSPEMREALLLYIRHTASAEWWRRRMFRRLGADPEE